MIRFRTYAIILAFCLLLFGCNENEKPEKPEHLIPIETMESIIYDSFVLNAAKASNRKTLENNGIYPQDHLFEKYNIDSTIFTESNAYYAYDVDRYQQMIANIKSRLFDEKNKYSEELKKEDELKKKKQDSIKKARKKRNDSILKFQVKKKKPLKAKTDS